MIKVVNKNIVNMDVDAIVNAANSSLMGGGGVDGAIHAAAGRRLDEECAKIGHCNTGDAVITSGCNLKAKYIIHTVGPIYGQYDKNTNEKLLASCYRKSLDEAKLHNLSSIGFPCISCGVYGFPLIDACKIAIKTVKDWLEVNNYEIDVFFVCFTEKEYQTYIENLK